jgi:hypothetical protein
MLLMIDKRLFKNFKELSKMKTKMILIICLSILGSNILQAQKKQAKDETVFYDIIIQFEGSADCDPCNGPYLTKLFVEVRFEGVKIKFSKYKDKGGLGSYNWYFSAFKKKKVQGYPLLALMGEGKISQYDLCAHTPKGNDCNDLAKCFFTKRNTVLMPVIRVISAGEIEDDDDLFGLEEVEMDTSNFDIAPLVNPGEMVMHVVFGLPADEMGIGKAKVEWSCEDWKEPNSIHDIDFMFAVPKLALLQGEDYESKFDFVHEDVPGSGSIRVVFFSSN